MATVTAVTAMPILLVDPLQFVGLNLGGTVGPFKTSSIVRRIFTILPLALFMVSFQNCSQAQFSAETKAGSNTATGTLGQGGTSGNSGGTIGSGGTGGTGTGTVDQPNTNPGSCHTVLHQQTVPVKVMFVVDTSGSNAGSNGTDPNRVVRGGSIQAFFNDLKSKYNFYWGFVTFAGTTATPIITDGVTPLFTASPTEMQNAIGAFSVIPDGGNTPYRAALDRVVQAISHDNMASMDTKYIVVFLSDGLPQPEVSDAQLATDVATIMNLKPSRVTFNTIYYGPTNPTASTRLATMAKNGLGNFLDTNANPTGTSFLISNIVNVPGQVCTK